jgi:hypothetical protein
MKAKKDIRYTMPRKRAVPFERHSADAAAIVGGKFTANPGDRVHAWRQRSGSKPTWHDCTVIRVSPAYVELWDDTLDQWYTFNPESAGTADIRLWISALPAPGSP